MNKETIKIIEIINEIMSFEFQFTDLYDPQQLQVEGSSETIFENKTVSFTKSYLDELDYVEYINLKKSELNNSLINICKIVDTNVKKDVFSEIYKSILNTQVQPLDPSNYPFSKVNIIIGELNGELDTIEWPHPSENCVLLRMHSFYSSLKEEILGIFIEISKLYGGFTFKGNNLEGPFKSNNISKNRIQTLFDKNELGYFLFLCKKCDIFISDKKASICDMIANNVITKKGDHFSKNSLETVFDVPKAESIKISVKQRLKKLIDQIDNDKA
ncbi:MAG: hypothetical protein V9E90_02185 [Saprospiraceae bacterium]